MYWCFWTVVLEKTLESPLKNEIQPVHPKGDHSWIIIGRTDAEAETPILWPADAKNWLLKRPWCWQRLKAGREGNDRGWDGWMASPTQWTWVWVNSGSWWWTGRHGMLQSMGLQRARHNWAELNWTLSMCPDSPHVRLLKQGLCVPRSTGPPASGKATEQVRDFNWGAGWPKRWQVSTSK